MDGPTLKGLPPFFSIGYREKINVLQTMKRPLSGYLGGSTPRGGYWTSRLEEQWCDAFKCKYAIPCNSATSGLLAACMAVGVGPGDEVWTTPYSMSATAACALVLGAKVKFIDIEPVRYSINLNMLDAAYKSSGRVPKAVIVTNLFGHPAYLNALRMWCDSLKTVLIEDNAQAIFAKENGRYAGTIGHIGVFSLNVHKHIQCGEGGVICTNDPELSSRLRCAINHGELSSCYYSLPRLAVIGLNLRMTEPVAAIACAQLGRADEIMGGRRKLAMALNSMMRDILWVKPPVEDVDCRPVYYVWAGRIDDKDKRYKFTRELMLRGFPLRPSYSPLLPEVFRTGDKCPTALRIDRDEILTFEVCAYDPKAYHLQRMREIVEYVAENINRKEQWKSRDAESAGVNLPSS